MSGSSHGIEGGPLRDWYTSCHGTSAAPASRMTTSATARCWAAYAPPSPKPRSAGPDFAASVEGIEWVANSTSTCVVRSSPGTDASSPAIPSRTPSMNGCTKPGWSKNWRTLSIWMASGPSPRPVSASASAKSSRYWRQLEYELYALVAIAMSFVWPAALASSSASLRYGSQLRLPQSTGRSMPRLASSASRAAFSCRFCSLIGLTPPKWR